MTKITLRKLRQSAPAGLVANDRGNGAAGPYYIEEWGHEYEVDSKLVTLVAREDDPDAWRLAEEASRDLGFDGAVECVAVGEVTPAGYQMIVGY